MNEKLENIAFKIRTDAKEECRIKLEKINFTLSSLAQAALYKALFMTEDELKKFILEGLEREVEYEHRKLEEQIRFSEIVLARKKLDVYGPEAIERAIRENYLPNTCIRENIIINRSLVLVFQKVDSDKWDSDDVSRFFEKLKSQPLKRGHLLAENVQSKEHADEIYKFWADLGFSDEEIRLYFLDFKAIELLK